MQLRIFFNPIDMSVVEISSEDVYIVIDVVRATTTLTTMFDSGAIRVYGANSLKQARQAKERFPQYFLCGERHGLPVAGFDYGNSPNHFSHMDLTGCELILTTTNGTRAFYACPMSSTRLAGCFYNARAVVARALAVAREKGSNIVVVCAAESNYFALDDATCAGYLALEAVRQNPEIEIGDDGHAALTLCEAFPMQKLRVTANSARAISEMHLERDLDYSMKIDGSSTVPMVVGQEAETGLLIFEKAK